MAKAGATHCVVMGVVAAVDIPAQAVGGLRREDLEAVLRDIVRRECAGSKVR